MRVILVVVFAIVANLFLGGCITLSESQKKLLAQRVEQLEKQDRISKSNAEDLRKILGEDNE